LEKYFQNNTDPPQTRNPYARKTVTSPLLPAAELREPAKQSTNDKNEILSPPSEIQRPKSALHSGDFTQEHPLKQRPYQSFQPDWFPRSDVLDEPLGISPSTPWYNSSSTPAYNPFQSDPRFPPTQSTHPEPRPFRSRGPSLSSYSSSFILKAPTSPLVQQSNNTDLDFSPLDLSTSSGKNRRHTLPPRSLHSLHSSPYSQLLTQANGARASPPTRREVAASYQAHQPRRSLTSNWSLQAVSTPQTPAFLRSRRPSLSDVSPLHHAPMVGSYEESILRGRMSTTPSKPLSFMAQIGVLGKGNCKPNLRCPPHVMLPFPAVFYSYGTGTGRNPSSVEDGPSPYVGLIDIENSLKKEVKEKRWRKDPSQASDPNDSAGDMHGLIEHSGIATQLDRRKKEKKKRRSQSPKAPPGGSYRIPQQGQLQIVIKNPNKTAVKLFLVPYDLQGMEAGTKTFLRQRSYSAGPIIDMPLTSGVVPATDKAETARSTSENPKDKPVLRYLIHLNICCPSKGRYYLYRSIRVVFANRVPDGKEKLRNETESPSPRYSAYKPGKISNAGLGSGSNTIAEKTFRRRSSGFALGGYDTMDGIAYTTQPPFSGGNTFSFNGVSPPPPIQPIPFNLVRSKKEAQQRISVEKMVLDSPIGSRPTSASDMQSPTSDKTSRLPNSLASPGMSSSWRSNSSNSNSSDGYNKLNKGDVGYGGNVFGHVSNGSENNEGLLARRLKGLDVQRSFNNDEDL
ncbi:MAG: hypothetical protein M1830_005041, partial [Pleopsidium flavum]